MEKPAYGQPCNGCGQCCQDQLCPLGRRVFPTSRGGCPALMKFEDRFECGLVLRPRQFAPFRTAVRGVDAMRNGALLLIGAGNGCDALLVDEKAEPTERARMKSAADAIDANRLRRARAAWDV